MLKLFQRIIFCKFNERIFACVRYIIYCDPLEISLGKCLRIRYVGLSKSQNIARVEIFTQVDISKSVWSLNALTRHFSYICNVKLSKFLFHNLFN